MIYQHLIDGMKKYGSTERDICLHGVGIEPEKIRPNVILAPWWEPSSLPALGEAEYLSESDYSAIKVWDLHTSSGDITYIRTGIGAPVLMDALLSLGVTSCRNVIFIGSVGSLDENIRIGDIVLPSGSICGDGASRYLTASSLPDNDVFGAEAKPDAAVFDVVRTITDAECTRHNVQWHIAKAYSIDTVFAQYAHIDEILALGCRVIEMETAAAFRAAEIAGLSLAAVFSVSDNTVVNKSLISGRTAEEMEYRRFVRKTLFPEILLKTFAKFT